eukprot:s360_g18.t1
MRVQEMGFQVLPNGHLRDRYGSFCPQTAHMAEVELRLHLAWTAFVAAHLTHRSEFSGIGLVDTLATQRALRALSLSDRALLRLGLTGGFVTEDVKSKWNQQSRFCKHCGDEDSLCHRYWVCPAYAVARQELAPSVLPVLDSLPPALTLRGWSLFPSTHAAWLTHLDSLSRSAPPVALALQPDQWNHVFTDGSCLAPRFPTLRMAAWAAVLALPHGPLSHGCSAGVLGASVLPGLCQTAFRAELYALAVVLHWCALVRTKVCVWLDCLGVVNRFILLLVGGWTVEANQPHADLWFWIQQSVREIGVNNVRVQKVTAHKRLDSVRNRLDWWTTYHNDAADRAAKLANQSRPAWVWTLWKRHVHETFAAETLAVQVRALHLAVARAEVRGRDSAAAPEPAPQPEVRATRQFELRFDNSGWTGAPLANLAHRYGMGHATRAVQWWTARTSAGVGSLQWISFVQLFVDFNLTFGQPGPLKIGNQWVDVANRPYLTSSSFAFRDKVRWFRRFLQNMLQEGCVTTVFEQCRPASQAIQAYLPCLALQWSEWHLERVEQWLMNNLQGACTRNAAVLTKLPHISQDRAMDIGLP